MKIGLISPKRGRLVGNRDLEEFFWHSEELSTRANTIYRWPELGLLTLAGLMPDTYDIKYIDEEIDVIHFEENFDLVGITGLTPKATRAYEIADEFRKRGVFVIMGGPHASVLPDEARQHVDTVFIGEAQKLWKPFINDFSAGSPKAAYSANGTFADLKESPIPRYNLLKRYVGEYKVIPIETTRGCPHDCEFCSSTRLWGRTYRRKTVQQVLNEIEEIKKVAPRKYLFFVDDNMFVDRQFAYELLEAFGTVKNLRWFAQTDISIAEDDKLLSLLYKAGCREVLIGFETLSKENMRMVDSSRWKMKQLEKYPWAIERIQSKGVTIYGSFILGMDYDDPDAFDTLRQFIDETKIMGYQILIMTPMPGTRIYERLEKENRLFRRPWGQFSTYRLNYQLKKMTQTEFEQGMLRLYRHVYSDEHFRKRKRQYLRVLKDNLGNSGERSGKE